MAAQASLAVRRDQTGAVGGVAVDRDLPGRGCAGAASVIGLASQGARQPLIRSHVRKRHAHSRRLFHLRASKLLDVLS